MKYIFILAQDGDISVDDVISWIKKHNEYQVVRINDTDNILNINLSIEQSSSDFSVTISENVTIHSNQIHSYWYRRGQFAYNKIESPSYFEKSKEFALSKAINDFYEKEWEFAIDFVHFLLKKSNIFNIGSFFDNKNNKLTTLQIAKDVGFLIPKTLVSNDVNVIRTFFCQNEKIISKAVRSPGGLTAFGNKILTFSFPTSVLTITDFDRITSGNTKFQPTLFQKYIDKEFEIRTFYLNKKTYSMAIFSQNNEKTKIDFRNYDYENPNRCVPYILPEEVNLKVVQLMEKLDYNTGSLDIIFNGQDYFFLEVNPAGQFGWLSKHCNYYIEKEIAKQLIEVRYEK